MLCLRPLWVLPLLVAVGCGGPELGSSSRGVDDPACAGKNTGDSCDNDNNLCTLEFCAGQPGNLRCQGTGGTAPVGFPCNSDGDQCTVDHCGNTMTGQRDGICHHDFTPGLPCNDGDICTSNDTCQGTSAMHTCTGTPAPNGTACTSDGFGCTLDQCESGVCEHIPNSSVCADTLECSLDLCDPSNPAHDSNGCVHLPQPSSTPCTPDAVPCTRDHCSGVDFNCAHTPDNSLCDDNRSCTNDICDFQVGCQHVPSDALCNDGNVCNGAETCNPAAGNSDPATGCVPGMNAAQGTACATDGVACTIDQCDGSGACLHTPDNSQCNDGVACTSDMCTATGCVNVPNNGACDDGIACTVDVCGSSGCTHMANNSMCDDGNQCTVDVCDVARGCQHNPLNGNACNDNNVCTVGDRCVGGVCVGASVMNCDDGNPCTIDSCDAVQGCLHTPAQASIACDDGNACTSGDHCNGSGQCTGGATINCDDGNQCTTDSCNTTTGCVHTSIPNCCTTDSQCADTNPCTRDSCDTSTGTCHNTPITGCCNANSECSDGDPCTADVCSPTHTCEHGPILGCCTMDSQCADQTACTADHCDTGTHTCFHDPVPNCCTADTQCDDGNFCTTDHCDTQSGTCSNAAISGCCNTAAECNDNNACTLDACDQGTHQCRHESISGCCATNSDCTGSTACVLQTCDNHICTDHGVTGCCTTDSDCSTGDPCNVGACVNHTCQITQPSNCCRNDRDCDDANICTRDSCNTTTHTCSHTPLTTGGCCASDTDCNDRDICTDDSCNTTFHVCSHTMITDCCRADFECNDNDVCTADSCTHVKNSPIPKQCVNTPIPACGDGGVPDGGQDGGRDGSTDAPGADGSTGVGLHGGGGCGCEVASRGETGWPAIALVIGLVLLLRRRVWFLLALLLATGGTARAAGATTDGELFHPAPGWDRYLSQQGAGDPGHLLLGLGAWMSYADQPLIASPSNAHVIDTRLGLDITASLGVWHRMLFWADMPFVPHQTGTLTPIGGSMNLPDNGVGDLRLGAKGLLGTAHQGEADFGFALGGFASLPTGSQENFTGSQAYGQIGPMVEVRVGDFSAAINVAAVLREDKSVWSSNLKVGSQLMTGGGVRVPLHGPDLAAIGEIYAFVPIDGSTGEAATPVEALAGLRLRVGDIELTAAGGKGLDQGYGAPNARIIAGVALVPRPPAPAPPPVIIAEAPKPIPPAVPPPPADSDGDGLTDDVDRCPHEPGPKENQGCPDTDTDGDGIIDRKDKCPETPGIPELDGCPDKDTDGDGIPDRKDKCPTEPETFNGFEDEDGCPDKGPELARITETKIDIKQPIYFQSGKATIEKKSFPVLAVVATLLKLHPEIKKVRVEGHTDSKGKHDYNMKLSDERANAVVGHLVLISGIDPARLEAKGFGPDKPVAPNMTKSGRSLNRRVEFLITERAPPAPPPPTTPRS
jgi:outer membrane protein OmpA-like peptidoglycan-associated protein